MKICQQCRGKFEISDVEKEFFQSIGLKFGEKVVKIPEPKLCPDCRSQHRMMFRNDRVFYSRKCDLSGKKFISLYPEDSEFKVYHPDEWYGDGWDVKDFGRDFDFKKPFFEQYKELMMEVPRLGIDIVNCENSNYCNYCGDDKNCYLDIAGEANEDCYFNLFVKYSKNVVDCTFVYNSEVCYECINSYDCYGCQNSMYLENCSDCYFCFDLKGCRNCIFCSGLRDKEYFIFNKKKTKAEYEKYMKGLKMTSHKQREKLYAGWTKFKLENAVFRDAYLLSCENCSGNNLKNCKNTLYSFNATNCEDCRYLFDVLDAKDCQDLNYSLYKPEVSYELISTLNMVRCAFCMASHYNSDCYYVDLTNNSQNLFGCIGMNHAQYCILNKQYTRSEYEELVPRIIEQMKENGDHRQGGAGWGQFFPVELSPFAYNETVADEYFRLGKEEVGKNGWRWKEGVGGSKVEGGGCVVADDIGDVDERVCKEILMCEKSGKSYKIIPQELKFYKKMGIPVPRRAPDARHRDRIELRTPRQLWKRKCMKCGAEVLTAYSGERKEKIYCEECYLGEVY
ncbi:MAG: hypothetical protein V1679_01590 [Candidatus Peregrinibacteria bacterium]